MPPKPRPRGDRKPDREVEGRQAAVAYLHALGHGPAEIAGILDKPVRTIGRDLMLLRTREVEPRTAAELGAQLEGVVNWLTTPLANLLKAKDEYVQITAVRALWAIFKDKIAVEQALGFAPKEPERLELVHEVGTRMQEVLLAVSRRMTPEAATELARAVKAVHAEVPEVSELLVP